jgi:plastocyanin
MRSPNSILSKNRARARRLSPFGLRTVLVGSALATLCGCASGIGRPVQEVTATTGADQVQRVTVTTHSFYYDPNRIVVRVNVPVELTVRNGAFFVPHDFSLAGKEAGIDVDVRVGLFHASKKVRFTPTATGEFPFHCDVDAHMTKGMTGALVVR